MSRTLAAELAQAAPLNRGHSAIHPIRLAVLLAVEEDSLLYRRLRELLGLTQTTIHDHVEALVVGGFVVKEPAIDRRLSFITITPKGLRLLRTAARYQNKAPTEEAEDEE